MELPEILKTLGDSVRLRILGLLINSELCVCDIEFALDISQVNASRHLAKMKSAGILSSRKTAQWVYYSIDMNFKAVYSELLVSILSEIIKTPACKKDAKRLKSFRKSKEIQC